MHLTADGGVKNLPHSPCLQRHDAADTWQGHPCQGEEEEKISPLAFSDFNSLLNAPVTLQTPDSAMPHSFSSRLLQPTQAQQLLCEDPTSVQKKVRFFSTVQQPLALFPSQQSSFYRPVSAAPCSPPMLLCTIPPAGSSLLLGLSPHSVPCLGTRTAHRHCSLL